MAVSDEAAATAEFFDDDLLDLEALLGDDTFMFNEARLD